MYINSRVYHAVVNEGISVAEAINFQHLVMAEPSKLSTFCACCDDINREKFVQPTSNADEKYVLLFYIYEFLLFSYKTVRATFTGPKFFSNMYHIGASFFSKNFPFSCHLRVHLNFNLYPPNKRFLSETKIKVLETKSTKTPLT